MRNPIGIMNEVRRAFNIASWKPSKEEWLFASACISLEEKRRVHQFVFKNDAKLALAGRLLIKSCINKLIGIPWQEISLGRTEKSKPYLVGYDDNISFNVSHQGNYSIIAASTQNKVGVDVMKIDHPTNTTVKDFFTTMRRQFTPEEWQVIKSKSGEWSQMASFYRFWCLKESYVKAVGTGLGTSTAEYMRFELNTENLSKKDIVTDSILYVRGEKVDWTFHESMLDDHHIATVALMGSNNIQTKISSMSFEFANFNDIIKHAVQLRDIDPDDWSAFSNKKVKAVRHFDNKATSFTVARYNKKYKMRGSLFALLLVVSSLPGTQQSPLQVQSQIQSNEIKNEKIINQMEEKTSESHLKTQNINSNNKTVKNKLVEILTRCFREFIRNIELKDFKDPTIVINLKILENKNSYKAFEICCWQALANSQVMKFGDILHDRKTTKKQLFGNSDENPLQGREDNILKLISDACEKEFAEILKQKIDTLEKNCLDGVSSKKSIEMKKINKFGDLRDIKEQLREKLKSRFYANVIPDDLHYAKVADKTSYDTALGTSNDNGREIFNPRRSPLNWSLKHLLKNSEDLQPRRRFGRVLSIDETDDELKKIFENDPEKVVKDASVLQGLEWYGKFGTNADEDAPVRRFGRNVDEDAPVRRFGRNAEKVAPVRRFGRNAEEDAHVRRFGRDAEDAPVRRFGRNAEKVAPVRRFGRNAEEVAPVRRFGRNAKEDAPARRFGRNAEEDALVRRFGRNADESAPVRRFGRNAEEDAPVRRFGRNAEEVAPVRRFGRNAEEDAPVRRFGRDAEEDAPVRRFGRNAEKVAPVRRFGRNAEEVAPVRRFGRNAKEDAPVRRFGRNAEEDALVRRFGRNADEDAPLRRFGRNAEEDAPVRRFGRDAEEDAPVRRFGRKATKVAPVRRFGRNAGEDATVRRFGRNSEMVAPVRRFGRNAEEDAPVRRFGSNAEEAAPVRRFGRNAEKTAPVRRFGRNAEKVAPVRRFGKNAEEDAPVRRFGRNAEEDAPVRRFGRNAEEDAPVRRFGRNADEVAPVRRFGRNAEEDAPVRRFGRNAEEDAPVRWFGRIAEEDAPVRRFGRNAEEDAPVRRFGRNAEEDAPVRRFGRNAEEVAPVRRFGRNVEEVAPVRRFGRKVKDDAPRRRFGRNVEYGFNLLRPFHVSDEFDAYAQNRRYQRRNAFPDVLFKKGFIYDRPLLAADGTNVYPLHKEPFYHDTQNID